MEKLRLHGNLKQTPFAFLLFRIWKSKGSGILKIRNHESERKSGFLKGNLAPGVLSFPGDDFLHDLAERKLITEPQLRNILKTAREKETSPLRCILQKKLLSPLQIWDDMSKHIQSQLFPVFDWGEAEFFFDTELEQANRIPLFIIETPEFILDGIRKMSHFQLMASHLPSPENKCLFFPSEHTKSLRWHPSETYVFRLLQKELSLAEIHQNSELGIEETNRVLFAMHALKMTGNFRKTTQKPGISGPEIHRIFEHFNRCYIYIFKFLSKETGPVTFKILEKCLFDVKSHLPSGFHNLRFESNGRITLGSTPATPTGLPGGMDRNDFLKGLNEILNAEILAVKKTLGSEHESNLVKNLNALIT